MATRACTLDELISLICETGRFFFSSSSLTFFFSLSHSSSFSFSDWCLCLQLEDCLKHIFAKYCTPPPTPAPSEKVTGLLVPSEDAYLTEQGLDAWARDTNGAPFDEETKEELLEFLDVNDDGSLTYVSLLSSFA